MNEYMDNLNRTPEQQLADLDERAAIKQEELNSQMGFHRV